MSLVTFSTLACPSWSMEKVIAKASEFGYDGVEWRGGAQGHIQPSAPAVQKAALRQICSDAGLMVLAVTTYTSFVSDLAEERQANKDELRRYSDLAAELGAHYVRAFLGELPTGTNPDTSMYDRMADCLSVASEHALSVGVKIAIEPHDNFARSSAVAPVLDRTRSQSALCVIWDIGNAFAAGEDPVEGFDFLKDRLAYIQVKDGKGRGPDWQLCSLGQGEVPLGQAFELLLANGYGGAFSVEWEYAWHPELDPPEAALPAALQVVRNLLAGAQSSQTTD
jgi:sugar phosphate isomerase/epimerase